MNAAGRGLQALGGLAPAIPLWFWWAADGGGYAPTRYLPGLAWLAIAGVLLAVAVPARALLLPGRVALTAVTLLAAWAVASFAWADDRGAAATGSARWVLLALAVALPLLRPPSPRGLRAAVAAAAVAGVVGAAAGLIAVHDAAAGALQDGRLSAPTHYPNATAVLLLAAAAAGLGGAAAARHRLGSGLLAAAGAALVATAVLTQSRGGVLSAAVVAAVALCVHPARVRLLVLLAVTAGMVALGWPPLTEVRRLAMAGQPGEGLGQAVAAIVAAGILTGAVAAVLPRHRVIERRAPRRWRTGVAVAAAAAVLVATVSGGPGFVQDRWHSFTTPDYGTLESSSSRFTGDLGSNRYDYWRAAVRIAADHPVLGVGADGFAAPYLLHRHSDMTPRYAHEWWLETAATLGLPGLLALLAAVGALTWSVVRQARGRAWSMAAVLPAVVVGTQASGDWTHTFGAATLPALGLLAAVAGTTAPATPPRRIRRGAVAAAAVAALLLCGTAFPLFTASRLQARGEARAASEPAAALDDFASAARWDPFAAGPEVSRGSLALLHGDPTTARAAFTEAVDRDADAWFPTLVLGLLEAHVGHRAGGARLVTRARELNPREPEVARAAAALRAGRPPDPRAVAAAILSRR